MRELLNEMNYEKCRIIDDNYRHSTPLPRLKLKNIITTMLKSIFRDKVILLMTVFFLTNLLFYAESI